MIDTTFLGPRAEVDMTSLIRRLASKRLGLGTAWPGLGHVAVRRLGQSPPDQEVIDQSDPPASALTGPNDVGFPYAQVTKSLFRLDPDVRFLSRDQIDQRHGGRGLIREPAILNYLRNVITPD